MFVCSLPTTEKKTHQIKTSIKFIMFAKLFLSAIMVKIFNATLPNSFYFQSEKQKVERKQTPI